MTDRIVVSGIRSRGFHGVHESERRQGQDFVVDVVLELDTTCAASTDDVRATVDYGTVAQRDAEVVAGEPVNRSDARAQRVAAACLVDSRVEGVEVIVHKPQAPIPVPFQDVSVTVVRNRA